jgi:hypothetical protein
MFLVDITIQFCSAFYDLDYNVIDDRKVIKVKALIFIQTIAMEYICGWFFIDLISVIPFDVIFATSGSFNRVARFTRIGKLYKIIRLSKMIRILKIV